jgi:competence protein ComGF
MIDNLENIKPLLNFDNVGDFYMLYVFKRKKDQSTDKANHQSVRTIKTYCIGGIEQLEERYDEIKQLCEMFKARAYIHIQKQNHKDVAMNMITEIVTRIQSGQINQKNVFDSVVGQIKTNEKRWIVDIDSKDGTQLLSIMTAISICRPDDSDKVEAIIPTKSGFHLITKRFDVMEFKKQYPDIDIQKKNPTLLYYPNSLDI